MREYCPLCGWVVGVASSGPYPVTEKDGKRYMVEMFACLECFVTISSRRTEIINATD